MGDGVEADEDGGEEGDDPAVNPDGAKGAVLLGGEEGECGARAGAHVNGRANVHTVWLVVTTTGKPRYVILLSGRRGPMGMRLRRAATTKRTTTRNGGTQSEWVRRREPRSVGWHHDGVKEHEERTNGEGGRESGHGTRSDLAGPEPVEHGDREEVAVGVAHATAARLRLGLSEGEEEEPAGEGGHRHQQRADEGRKREGRHRCGVWVGSFGAVCVERGKECAPLPLLKRFSPGPIPVLLACTVRGGQKRKRTVALPSLLPPAAGIL